MRVVLNLLSLHPYRDLQLLEAASVTSSRLSIFLDGPPHAGALPLEALHIREVSLGLAVSRSAARCCCSGSLCGAPADASNVSVIARQSCSCSKKSTCSTTRSESRSFCAACVHASTVSFLHSSTAHTLTRSLVPPPSAADASALNSHKSTATVLDKPQNFADQISCQHLPSLDKGAQGGR
jgi:hypothetical protein